MRLTQTQNGYMFTKEDGTTVGFTFDEIKFIQDELETELWRSKLEDQIDINSENLDYISSISPDEFFDLCMGALVEKKALYGDDFVPDYEEVVFDVAQENGVWLD